ncbi:MAG: substrate-binding domain-containing protein [Desulfobacteraceae bacterium]|nr:substrate-binding domain-containing protein [Desulfobacteraceae bacterium]
MRALQMKRILLWAMAIGLVWAVVTSVSSAADSLTMATTTSTDNTGLLDELMPEFTKDTGIDIKWTATGTGKALKLGENCDVDVLMVHAPPAEKKFVDAGFGVNRREIMYNDFVLIGPPGDPAGISGKTVAEAMMQFEKKKAVFVSRGDNSGTNKKEIGLWKAAGLEVPDRAEWYVQTGQGMLSTIRIAAERDGYTLTDRGTYIKYSADHKGNPPLKVLVEGDAVLLNQYSVIVVNPDRCKNVKADLAEKFVEWITGDRAQQQIAEFRLLGQELFHPNAK